MAAPHTPVLLKRTSSLPGAEDMSIYAFPSPGKEDVARTREEKTVYLYMMLLGAACLLPWKAYITAVDYFQMQYPGRNAEFYFALVYNGPLIAGLGVMNYWGRYWDLRRRIYAALTCMVACVSMIFVLDGLMSSHSLTETQGFQLTLLTVFSSGAATSVLQGSLYGLAGLFGEHFTQALQVGKAWAGVAVVLLRMATKALPSFTVRTSTLLYFGLGDAVLCLGFFVFIRLLNFDFVQTRLAAGRGHHQADYSPVRSYGAVNGDPADEEAAAAAAPAVSLSKVFRTIAGPVIIVWMTFTVCIGLFPGMTTSLQSTTYNLQDGWYPLVMIFIFDLGDLIGKELPAHKLLFNARTIWVPAALHLVFIPLFILAVRDNSSEVFGNDNFQFAIVLLLGISTGYIGCSAMMLAPQMVPDREKEAAGVLETFFLVGGLFSGSVLGVILGETVVPSHVKV